MIKKNNETGTVEPIVFVNNPIQQEEKDAIGFSTQVEAILNAIGNGATMIGIIADYGTGKTSMTEMLGKRFQNKGNPRPIKINMWDSVQQEAAEKESKNKGQNGPISSLTKSFLFQLANGKSQQFGSYISKLLSKNYGNISFATNHFVRLLIFLCLALLSYAMYKISGVSGTGVMQYLPDGFRVASYYYIKS